MKLDPLQRKFGPPKKIDTPNLCPEKYILSQRGSEQLECFRISSRTMSLGSSNLNFSHDPKSQGENIKKNQQYVPIWVLLKAFSSISFRKSCKNLSGRSSTKTIKVSVKKGLWSNFHIVKCRLFHKDTKTKKCLNAKNN